MDTLKGLWPNILLIQAPIIIIFSAPLIVYKKNSCMYLCHMITEHRRQFLCLILHFHALTAYLSIPTMQCNKMATSCNLRNLDHAMKVPGKVLYCNLSVAYDAIFSVKHDAIYAHDFLVIPCKMASFVAHNLHTVHTSGQKASIAQPDHVF